MPDLNILRDIFEPYKMTLKETSYDKTNKEYLCKSTEEVFNFDEYMEVKYKSNKKSFDTLYFDYKDSHIYCVEFKKREHGENSSKPGHIKGKFVDGINELKNIFEAKGLETKNYKFHIFVIFKFLIKHQDNKKNIPPEDIFNTRNRTIMYAIEHAMQAEKDNFLIKDDDFKRKIPLYQEGNTPDVRVGRIRDFMKDYRKIFNHESTC